MTKYAIHKQHGNSHISEITRTTLKADNDNDIREIVKNCFGDLEILNIDNMYNIVTLRT